MRNNRTSGHAYERQIVKELKDMGYDAHTARYASRMMDDKGIDIVSDFPLKIQCKSSINQPNVHTILTDKECDVIFFRKQEKRAKNFTTVGEYALLRKEDLYKLIQNK
jgi:Holliday junction resolvase